MVIQLGHRGRRSFLGACRQHGSLLPVPLVHRLCQDPSMEEHHRQGLLGCKQESACSRLVQGPVKEFKFGAKDYVDICLVPIAYLYAVIACEQDLVLATGVVCRCWASFDHMNGFGRDGPMDKSCCVDIS